MFKNHARIKNAMTIFVIIIIVLIMYITSLWSLDNELTFGTVIIDNTANIGSNILKVMLFNNSNDTICLENLSVELNNSGIFTQCKSYSITYDIIDPKQRVLLKIPCSQSDMITSIKVFYNGICNTKSISYSKELLTIESISFNSILNRIYVYIRNNSSNQINISEVCGIDCTKDSPKTAISGIATFLPHQLKCIEYKYDLSLENGSSHLVYITDTSGKILSIAQVRALSGFPVFDSHNLHRLRVTKHEYDAEHSLLRVFIYNESKEEIILQKVLLDDADCTSSCRFSSKTLVPDTHNYIRDEEYFEIPINDIHEDAYSLSIHYKQATKEEIEYSDQTLLYKYHYLPVHIWGRHKEMFMPLFTCDLRPQYINAVADSVKSGMLLSRKHDIPAPCYVSLCPGIREEEYTYIPLYCDAITCYPHEMSYSFLLDQLKSSSVLPDSNNNIRRIEGVIEYAKKRIGDAKLYTLVGPRVGSLTETFNGKELEMLVYSCIAKGSNGIFFDVPKPGRVYRPDLLGVKDQVTRELVYLKPFLEIAHPIELAACDNSRVSADTLMCGNDTYLLILRNLNSIDSLDSWIPYECMPVYNVNVSLPLLGNYTNSNMYELDRNENLRCSWKHNNNTFTMNIDRINSVRVFLITRNELTHSGYIRVPKESKIDSTADKGGTMRIESIGGNCRFLGIVPCHSESNTLFRISNKSGATFKVNDIIQSGDQAHVILDCNEIVPNRVAEMKVILNPTNKKGYHATRIQLMDQDKNAIIFFISAIRLESIHATPRQVNFGEFYLTDPPERKISIASDYMKDMNIDRTTSHKGHVTVAKEDLVLKVTPVINTYGKFEDIIEISCVQADIPKLSVHVSGYVNQELAVTPKKLYIVSPEYEGTYLRSLQITASPGTVYSIINVDVDIPAITCRYEMDSNEIKCYFTVVKTIDPCKGSLSIKMVKNGADYTVNVPIEIL